MFRHVGTFHRVNNKIMKVFLTGGGTGGHFYPLIAVARALNQVADQEKIAKMDLVFMAESPYDKNELLQNGIRFKKIYSGKIRRYFSFLNIIDVLKLAPGTAKAVFEMYFDFPDVVFSKGGYESFPVVLAAKILGVPVIIHESDAIPGKANLWAGKFARRVAISFPKAGEYFPADKTALVGNPVRPEFFTRNEMGAKEFFNLENGIKIVLVMGGSQGAKNINDNFIDVLPKALKNYQIIHQCGKNNYEEVKGRTDVIMEDSPLKSRYHLFASLDFDSMRMAYGAADLVVSRAGASSVFETAASGLPAIVIPLNSSAQDHQRENAYAYAKSGAATVIEERNLKPHILLSEIERLVSDQRKMKEMGEAAKSFARADAAEKIAREIIRLGVEHK